MDAFGHIRFQVSERFEGSCAKAPIAIDELGFLAGLAILESDRGLGGYDLGGEAVFRPGGRCQILRALAERVGV